ncbi:uncharacterized protein [Dysidea avara]|uniref:uncharacterized protein n=1 Tax=Dysidea avara TaxID=196820 RepID=UPI00332055E0
MFAIPLEKAGIDTCAVQEEWDDMVEYSKRYLNLVQDYKNVWWKLFNCVDSKRWSNVLGLIELLFSLPLSNGHLERVFSQLKLIKTDHHTNLSENRLDQLVRINVEGPPLEKWDASSAIDTWYNDKSRRLTASSRATSTTGHGYKDTPTEKGDKHAFSLDEWKDWVQVSIDEEPNDDDDDDDDEEPLSFVDDEPCESGDDEPCESGDDCVIIE